MCFAQYFPQWTVRREIWTDALRPCNSGISTDVLLFSELGHDLHHHYLVFQGASPHVSLRRDYLTQLRVFVSQASAMDRCGQCSDTGLSSPAPASPRSVRQHDMGTESPRKSRRTSRRVRLTRVQDLSSHVLSSVTVWGAIIYDCRPPILPVTVQLRGVWGPCVVRSAVSSSLAALPEGGIDDRSFRCPGIPSALLDDPGTDLEDELCHFSPLQETISPFPESGDDVTIDVFPTYTMFPSVLSYAPPTSPVTPSLPVDLDYVSPGSPASMDHFIVGNRLLMDGPSDLPLLQLPLLPLPDSGVLPPGPVADPPGLNVYPSSAFALSDLSREGPFDAHLDTAAESAGLLSRPPAH